MSVSKRESEMLVELICRVDVWISSLWRTRFAGSRLNIKQFGARRLQLPAKFRLMFQSRAASTFSGSNFIASMRFRWVRKAIWQTRTTRQKRWREGVTTNKSPAWRYGTPVRRSSPIRNTSVMRRAAKSSLRTMPPPCSSGARAEGNSKDLHP